MKILFVSPYPPLAGSSRLRIHQYLPYLQARGHEVMVWSFLNEKGYQRLYQQGNFFSKAVALLAAFLRSFLLLPKIKNFEICVIHREVVLIGGGLIERIVARTARHLVYDFDDAIFASNISTANRYFAFLKSTRKIPRLLARCDAAIVCNDYLESYARRFARRTYQLPTPVDTQIFTPRLKSEAPQIVIGWMGSHSTAPYLALAGDALKSLLVLFQPRLQITVIGAGDFRLEGIPAHYKSWQMETEARDLQQFDIGIMPMPDNEWTRGKCGFKALLYMSAGLPVVCSPVGFNREIVIPGENGFWAESTAQWREALQRLIEDAALRYQMGAAGRRLVEEKFSLDKCAPRLEEILCATVKEAGL